MSTGVDIMLFYKGVTFFPFLHRIHMKIENSFFSSIHYPPGPSGTAVGGKGLRNPLKFRRSQDFYIVSLIELNCNYPTSIRSQWILKNNSNTIPFDSQIETTFSEIFIPARKLPFGIFQLELTITLNKYPTLNHCSSVYVEIIPTNIIPNLVQLGTSMITSGFEQDLRLDPGTYSIDPDQVTFDSTVKFSIDLNPHYFSNL